MNSHTKILWTDQLSVKVGSIDDQHKRIFDVINNFIQEETLEIRSLRFAELLSLLTDYSLEHFRDEELYMKEHGFPGIKEHRAAHKHYIKKVAYFNHLYDDINPTKPEDVSDFLKEWWVNHIMQMDMDYKKFVENNNNGKQS